MLEKFSKKSKVITGAAVLAAAIGVGGNEIKDYRDQNLAGEQLYQSLQSPDAPKRTISNIKGELNKPGRAGGKLGQDSDKHLVFKEEGVAESDWNKYSGEYRLTVAARKFNYSFNGMKVSLDRPVTSLSARTLDLGLAVTALENKTDNAGVQK